MSLPMGTKAFVDPLGIAPAQEPLANDPTREAFERSAAEAFNLDSAILRLSQTGDGQVLLKFLRENTIEAGTWMAGLALERGLDAATANGFAREGQNALVRDIFDRIDRVKKAKSPEDYVNQLQMKGASNGT